MSEPIIEVRGLSKAYHIWEKPSARLRSPLLEGLARLFPKRSAPRRALTARAARHHRDFYALRDISFTVRRGEATGIIGRNGSGKSTLLQLIAGTLTPTSGSLDVKGRVSALLELGSGFNPDFTGRENVFLNGALFGFTRVEMGGKLEEIEAFADIGEFIEQPVKTYSSGMLMRLAFAVAITVQPDILIIDEALAVGDVFFTQKCVQRIREIVNRGATLILVSHDMGSIQSLCDRALLLNQGALAFDGAPEDCVSRYFNLHQPRTNTAATVIGTRPPVTTAARAAVVAADVLPKAKSRHGDRSLEILAAGVFDGQGSPSWEFEMMHRVSVRILVRANRAVRLPAIGLQLHDRLGNLVFAAGTPQLRFVLPSFAPGEETMLDFRLTLAVYPGVFTLSLDAAEYHEDNPNLGTFYDRVGGLGPLTVVHNAPGALPFYGTAQLPMEIGYV